MISCCNGKTRMKQGNASGLGCWSQWLQRIHVRVTRKQHEQHAEPSQLRAMLRHGTLRATSAAQSLKSQQWSHPACNAPLTQMRHTSLGLLKHTCGASELGI